MKDSSLCFSHYRTYIDQKSDYTVAECAWRCMHDFSDQCSMFILKNPDTGAKCRIFTVVLYEDSVYEYFTTNEEGLVYERKVQLVLYTLSGEKNSGGERRKFGGNDESFHRRRSFSTFDLSGVLIKSLARETKFVPNDIFFTDFFPR